MRKALLLSIVALDACTRDGPAPVRPAPAVEVVAVGGDAAAAASPPTSLAVEARELLAPYVVIHPKPARRTLYTWTTRDQIDELARDRVLLTRTESPDRGASYYEQRLAMRQAEGDRLAVALHDPAFAKARFAWASPWPTILGWEGEQWGDELISVVLRPQAWIVVFRTARKSFEVIDLDDKPVPLATALANPGRIGAVYFVNDDPGSFVPRGTYGVMRRMACREYVLCNEKMIESWSARSPVERTALETSARAIDALADWVAEQKKPPAIARLDSAALAAWNAQPGADPLETYEASLAMPNEFYQPNGWGLRALAKRLREAPVGGAAISSRPP
jgi:hypothetical protein